MGQIIYYFLHSTETVRPIHFHQGGAFDSLFSAQCGLFSEEHSCQPEYKLGTMLKYSTRIHSQPMTHRRLLRFSPLHHSSQVILESIIIAEIFLTACTFTDHERFSEIYTPRNMKTQTLSTQSPFMKSGTIAVLFFLTSTIST